MGGWGCPHEVEGRCQRVKGLPCDPGMKACILFGRFTWSNEAKNRPPRQVLRTRVPALERDDGNEDKS